MFSTQRERKIDRTAAPKQKWTDPIDGSSLALSLVISDHTTIRAWGYFGTQDKILNSCPALVAVCLWLADVLQTKQSNAAFDGVSLSILRILINAGSAVVVLAGEQKTVIDLFNMNIPICVSFSWLLSTLAYSEGIKWVRFPRNPTSGLRRTRASDVIYWSNKWLFYAQINCTIWDDYIRDTWWYCSRGLAIGMTTMTTSITLDRRRFTWVRSICNIYCGLLRRTTRGVFSGTHRGRERDRLKARPECSSTTSPKATADWVWLYGALKGELRK